MYVRGYLQGSENGRVVTIEDDDILQKSKSIDGCLKYFFRIFFLCQQYKLLFSLAFIFLFHI